MENSFNNGTVGIQLNKLNDVSIVNVQGRECVVIPIKENGIYISEKGTVMLSLFMTKMNEERWNKTHTLKRKLTKEEMLNTTKQQRDNAPIVGYYEPWKPKEYPNNQNQKNTRGVSTPQYYESGTGVENLPF